MQTIFGAIFLEMDKFNVTQNKGAFIFQIE